MKVKQISVFLGDRPQQLVDCTKTLSKNGIKIVAMILVNKSGERILHFVVSDPEKACTLLQRNGWGVGETEVMLVELSGKTKTLDKFLSEIEIINGVNVEYMYMGNNCQFVFRFDDLDAAIQIFDTGLENHKIH